jgi:hypothetical protein
LNYNRALVTLFLAAPKRIGRAMITLVGLAGRGAAARET